SGAADSGRRSCQGAEAEHRSAASERLGDSALSPCSGSSRSSRTRSPPKKPLPEPQRPSLPTGVRLPGYWNPETRSCTSSPFSAVTPCDLEVGTLRTKVASRSGISLKALERV